MWNQNVMDGLPGGEHTHGTQVECFLLEYASAANAQTARLWNFLYNPTQITWERRATYAEGATYATKTPIQQYQYTSGRSLRLPGVLLDAWWLGKTVQPLVDGLSALMEAKLSEQTYNPPVLSLVMAQRVVLAPCVLTSLSVTEVGWLAGGQSARVQVDIELLEVPSSAIDRGQQATTATPTPNTDGRPRLALTERQRAEGSAKAKAHLEAQAGLYIPRVTALIQSGQYFLSTDPDSGDVRMYDGARSLVGIVGRWDGQAFRTPGITNIPKR
jgi:hypothetical protein